MDVQPDRVSVSVDQGYFIKHMRKSYQILSSVITLSPGFSFPPSFISASKTYSSRLQGSCQEELAIKLQQRSYRRKPPFFEADLPPPRLKVDQFQVPAPPRAANSPPTQPHPEQPGTAAVPRRGDGLPRGRARGGHHARTRSIEAVSLSRHSVLFHAHP